MCRYKVACDDLADHKGDTELVSLFLTDTNVVSTAYALANEVDTQREHFDFNLGRTFMYHT